MGPQKEAVKAVKLSFATGALSRKDLQRVVCVANNSHQQKSRMICSILFRGAIWVCLKMGYTPNYSHLVGIMIINHWV